MIFNNAQVLLAELLSASWHECGCHKIITALSPPKVNVKYKLYFPVEFKKRRREKKERRNFLFSGNMIKMWC